MRIDDRIRLRHMLDAAREAQVFIQNHSRNDLDHDRMLVLSLVKAVEIVGEAANQISPAMAARAECGVSVRSGMAQPDGAHAASGSEVHDRSPKRLEASAGAE